jgi:hypothetical protein
MNYRNIPEELSHDIRDASLDETRFIFEDPHQPWNARSRVRTDREEDSDLLEDFNYVGSRDHY